MFDVVFFTQKYCQKSLTQAVFSHSIRVASEQKNYAEAKNKQTYENSTSKNNHYSQVVVFLVRELG